MGLLADHRVRVYATFTGVLTDRQQLIGAWLYAGPTAQIAASSALRLYGLRYLPADQRVHVLVAHRQRIQSVRIVQIRRTTRLDHDAVNNGVLRVCGPARAVIDAARSSLSLATVRAMVAQVVQEGMASVGQLRAELNLARRNGTALLRTTLAEVADGVRSVAEAALRSLLGRSRDARGETCAGRRARFCLTWAEGGPVWQGAG